MKLEQSKRVFWIVATFIAVLLLALLIGFCYLMIYQPNIVPPNETFGSFWLQNFSILIAAFAFAISALTAAYNALEQRYLRYMENYPYLEIFPILSVDALPLPIPRIDLPTELASFNLDYLKAVAPSHEHKASETDFRYLAIVLRNVGNGLITRATIAGTAEVPNRGFQPVKFKIDRKVNLSPGDTIPFTILPIAELPEYKVRLLSVEYYGHFVKLKDYDGLKEFKDVYPYSIPSERRIVRFFDDFENSPAGLGWNLDFWGQWQPTKYIYVPMPSKNEHYLTMSGDEELFNQIPHYNNQGGAYIDLRDIMDYGQTVRVTAYKVRSKPGTTAKLQLWCNDLYPNPKNRYSIALTPTEEWQEVSLFFTSTQSPHLRIHLLYSPGTGEIQVDRVSVETLYT
jgi:hypothetical protein